MDIPTYDVEHPPLHESSTSKLELVTFRAPLPSRGNAAVRKTFTSSNSHEALSELEVHKQLSSAFPNYFTQLYFHRTSPKTFLIMEYCDMGDLAQYLSRKRFKWDINQVHVVMWQLVNGLQKMHSLGISHGDIKPHNVFISAEGVCKIGDFGCAVKHSYPAQRNSEKQYSMFDFESDVYSLGKTFLECFAVEVGIDLKGKSESEIEYIIEVATSGYPPVYQTLITDMMKTDSSRRSTISEVFDALGSVPMEDPNVRLSIDNPDGETEPYDMVPPISVSQRSNSILDNHQQIPVSDRNFEVLAGQVETLLKFPKVDERLLKETLEKLIAEHDSLRGKISVKLIAESRNCCKCNESHLLSDSAELYSCGHILCRDCLNSTVTSVIHSEDRRLVAVVCPFCHLPFDPYNPATVALLTVYVLRDLDEMCLEETRIKCPKCSRTFDQERRSECRSIKCVCKYSFCSYCLKSSHKAGCTEYDNDQKRNARK